MPADEVPDQDPADWVEIDRQESGNMKLAIDYSPAARFLRIMVSEGEHVLARGFHPGYAPTFGLDVNDAGRAYSIADKLASIIDYRMGRPPAGPV